MKLHSLIAATLLCLASSSQAALSHQFNLNGSLKDSITDTSLEHFGGKFVEPASLGLLGAGLALVGWTRRRQRAV